MQVRVDGEFRAPLVALAKRRVTKWAAEVNRAVRELLEREGLWPPVENGQTNLR